MAASPHPIPPPRRPLLAGLALGFAALTAIAHIDGLTVTGNRVSLSSGQITDSTGVTYP